MTQDLRTILDRSRQLPDRAGEMCGFLHANGWGKSTTMLDEPTSGVDPVARDGF
jgi:ABC-type multidrug transport system ATPase subunit